MDSKMSMAALPSVRFVVERNCMYGSALLEEPVIKSPKLMRAYTLRTVNG